MMNTSPKPNDGNLPMDRVPTSVESPSFANTASTGKRDAINNERRLRPEIKKALEDMEGAARRAEESDDWEEYQDFDSLLIDLITVHYVLGIDFKPEWISGDDIEEIASGNIRLLTLKGLTSEVDTIIKRSISKLLPEQRTAFEIALKCFDERTAIKEMWAAQAQTLQVQIDNYYWKLAELSAISGNLVDSYDFANRCTKRACSLANMAAVTAHAGFIREAKQFLEDALQLDIPLDKEEREQFYLLVARAYAALGDFTKAEELREELGAGRIYVLPVVEDMVRYCIQERQFEEAIRYARLAHIIDIPGTSGPFIKANSDRNRLLANVAVAQSRDGATPEALSLLSDVWADIQLNIGNPNSDPINNLLYLVHAYLELGLREEAITAFKELYIQYPIQDFRDDRYRKTNQFAGVVANAIVDQAKAGLAYEEVPVQDHLTDI